MGAKNGKSRQVYSPTSSDEFERIEFPCHHFPKDSLFADDTVTRMSSPHLHDSRIKEETLAMKNASMEKVESCKEDEVSDEVDDCSDESTVNSDNEENVGFGSTIVSRCNFTSHCVTVGNTFNVERSKSLEESVKWENVKPGLLENLSSKLKTRWKQIKNRTLHPDDCGKTIKIDDCPLVTIQEEEDSTLRKSRLITDVEDFIDRCEKRNLVEGHASYGKTIYAKKILISWANGKFGNCSGKLSQFDFAFLVQAEDVVASSDFWDILFRQGKLENISRESFRKCIDEEQSRALILVDSAEFSSFENLINLEILPRSTIVVFSRPYALDRCKKRFVKTFFVCGFQEEQISRYSNLFGPQTEEKVKRLLRSESGSMLKSPFFLHHLCVIAENENELQICKSTTKVFCSVFSRAISKTFPGTDFTDLINVEFLINFGKICYSSVLCRPKGSSEIWDYRESDNKTCASFQTRGAEDCTCVGLKLTRPSVYEDVNFQLQPTEEFSSDSRNQSLEHRQISSRPLTKIVSKSQEIKMNDFRKILSLDLISRCNNSGNKMYRANHRECVDFLIALYLSKIVECVEFSGLIRKFLCREVDSSTLKFIVGLIPEKFAVVFQHLPFYLTCNWTLEWFVILGESGILNRRDISFPKFPDYLKLKLRPCMVTIPNEGFDLDRVEKRVFVEMNDKRELASTVKKYIRDICRHYSEPIRQIHLDFDNSSETLAFVVEFVFNLDEDGVKFDSAFIVAEAYDEQLADIVKKLVTMTKILSINVDKWEFDVKCDLNVENPNYVLQSFEIDVNSTSEVFDVDRFRSLKNILTSCKTLKHLQLSPVDNDEKLFVEIIDSLNLASLTLNPTGKRVRCRVWPRRGTVQNGISHHPSASAGKFSHASTNLSAILKQILCSDLNYLDISGLLIDKSKLKSIFRDLSTTQIKTLKLAHCYSLDHSINSIDLRDLVNPNRAMDVVDLSGWVISLSSGTPVGTVNTLIVHGAVIRVTNNVFEICRKLKIDQLHCDRQHLVDAEDYSCSLSILKVKNFLDDERPLEDLSRIVSRLSALRKIKLECKIEDFSVLDLVRVCDDLKKLSNLKCVHLVIKLSKKADIHLPSTLSKFFKVVNFLFFEVKIVKIVKLTLDFGAICIWDKSDRLSEILNSIEEAFRRGCLRRLRVTQSVESFDAFIMKLDSFCVDKNSLPFVAQLRPKSSLLKKTLDFIEPNGRKDENKL